MNIEVRSTFERDIKKIKAAAADKSLKEKIKQAIINIQEAQKLREH